MRPSATDSDSGQRVWARRQGLCRPGRRSVESETRTLARRGATPMPAYSHDHVADRHRIGARLGEATGGPIRTSGSVGASRRTSKRRCDMGPARTGTRQRSATAPAAIFAAGRRRPEASTGRQAGRRRGPAPRRAGCRRRTAPAGGCQCQLGAPRMCRCGDAHGQRSRRPTSSNQESLGRSAIRRYAALHSFNAGTATPNAFD